MTAEARPSNYSHLGYIEALDRLAAADRENAELRGEVERLGESQFAVGRALVNEQLRSERAESQLAAAQAQLAEAQEALVSLAAEDDPEKIARFRQRFPSAETFDVALPVGPELVDCKVLPNASCAHYECQRSAAHAALSAAPQPEPDEVPAAPRPAMVGCQCRYHNGRHAYCYPSCRESGGCDPEPPASDEPARCDCTCDRAKEGAAFHHPTCPSYISDEPARYCRVCGAPMSLHLDPPCRPAASGTPDGGQR